MLVIGPIGLIILVWLLLRPRKTIIIDPVTRWPVDPATGQVITKYAGVPRGSAKPKIPLWLFLVVIFGLIYGVCALVPVHAATIDFYDQGSLDADPVLNHTLKLGQSETNYYAPTHEETFFISPVKGNEISIDGQQAAPIGNDYHVEEVFAFSRSAFDSATFYADRTNITFGAAGGAVPEPSTWIMMLLGAALIVWRKLGVAL